MLQQAIKYVQSDNTKKLNDILDPKILSIMKYYNLGNMQDIINKVQYRILVKNPLKHGMVFLRVQFIPSFFTADLYVDTVNNRILSPITYFSSRLKKLSYNGVNVFYTEHVKNPRAYLKDILRIKGVLSAYIPVKDTLNYVLVDNAFMVDSIMGIPYTGKSALRMFNWIVSNTVDTQSIIRALTPKQGYYDFILRGLYEYLFNANHYGMRTEKWLMLYSRSSVFKSKFPFLIGASLSTDNVLGNAIAEAFVGFLIQRYGAYRIKDIFVPDSMEQRMINGRANTLVVTRHAVERATGTGMDEIGDRMFLYLKSETPDVNDTLFRQIVRTENNYTVVISDLLSSLIRPILDSLNVIYRRTKALGVIKPVPYQLYLLPMWDIDTLFPVSVLMKGGLLQGTAFLPFVELYKKDSIIRFAAYNYARNTALSNFKGKNGAFDIPPWIIGALEMYLLHGYKYHPPLRNFYNGDMRNLSLVRFYLDPLAELNKAYMAFCFLNTKFGEERTRQFLKLLVKDHKFDRDFSDVFGEKFPDFDRDFRTYMLKQLAPLSVKPGGKK